MTEEEATTNNNDNNNNIILSKEEREKKVIELYYTQRKGTKDITHELRMSPNTVGKILDKFRNSHENVNCSKT